MKKKVLALMLATVMTASVIVGCNSGKTGTENTGTETAAQEEYQFVSPEDAVKAAADGSAHVLDVRELTNYNEGNIANSEWQPIFPLEDDTLVDDMKAYATEKLNDGEKIYIVCNSGQRGAQKATGVLKDAGIDESLIYTVEGGAKALAEVDGALTAN